MEKYFHLNPSEKRAILLVAITLILINVFGHILSKDKISVQISSGEYALEDIIVQSPSTSNKSKSFSTSQDSRAHSNPGRSNKQIQVWRSRQIKSSDSSDTFQVVSSHNSTNKENQETQLIKEQVEIESVNPNTADKEALIAIGLKPNQAMNIIRYREKGGNFTKVEDIKKMYSIDDHTFTKTAQYFLFPEKELHLSASEGQNLTINANTASEAEWQKIKGIGPYYASKIVRYREKLGGFTHIDQIKETYDLPPEVIDENRSRFKLKTAVQKISINGTNFNSLVSHPYIDKRQASLLMKIQKLKLVANMQTLSEIFGPDELRRILPYLSLTREKSKTETLEELAKLEIH